MFSAKPGLAQLLNTTHLDGLLPGLVAKYGKGIPVDINFSTIKAPTTVIKNGSVGLNVDADIKFIVNNEVAVTLELTGADVLVVPTLKNFSFSLQVASLSLNDL